MNVLRDPDRAINCNRGQGVMSSDADPNTNRKSEQTDIVCLLSSSVFYPLFKLLSLPQSTASLGNFKMLISAPYTRHDYVMN